VVQRISAFGDERLGKSIVMCKDTPGFIANRIGTYWLHKSVAEAIKQNIPVETADAVLGKPMGVPRTGVFALLDLVGIDLMPHVLGSLMNALNEKDAFRAIGPAPKLLETMIADGYTGRKGKGGFYRLNAEKKKEVRNLQTGVYEKENKAKIDAAVASKKGGLKATITHDSAAGKYANSVVMGTLAYAASLVGEIANDIEQIDRAMRLGFNWKFGPFELLDQLGTAWVEQYFISKRLPVPHMVKMAAGRPFYKTENGVLHMLMADGGYAPVVRPVGVLLLQDIKRKSKPVFTNFSASVWDIGDRVACLEFHSKMNTFDPFILWMVKKAVKELPAKGFRGLIVYNEGSNFSVGANILMLDIAGRLRLWPAIRWILHLGQSAFQQLKYAPFPVVAAPSGMALGGACEIILHSDAIVAHAETYTGLVEVGVGIIPGWGGCAQMLLRIAADKKTPKGPMPPVSKAFENIATAKVSPSAMEARDMLILRDGDEIVMNRDRLLAQAKAKVLSMAKGYMPPMPQTISLPGPSGAAALTLAVRDFAKKGIATPHDVTISAELGRVLTGGETDLTQQVTEQRLLELEREHFVNLCKTKQTRARVRYMLAKGKPLRN
ncbi:MAG: 3-hydroxyacyl-CoA dehydrogenase family protein, partial [Alphaproteobacteria bacterium]